MLSSISQDDVDQLHAQRERLTPLAATLGLDYAQAERDDDYELLRALDLITYRQQRARAVGVSPGSQRAEAERIAGELRALRPSSTAAPSTRGGRDLGDEVVDVLRARAGLPPIAQKAVR